MYQNILVATDGSELAAKAVSHAAALAKLHGANLSIVTVTEAWHTFSMGETSVAFPIDQYEESTTKSANAALEAAKSLADAEGVACKTIHVKDSHPGEGIISAAEKNGCDLVVMASHGRRGISRLLLGSQASHVVSHSHVPVLVCR